jgi:Family of unknown function (DUF6283)
MMSECSKQRNKACKSCPWTRTNPEYYFDPKVLKKSIVDSAERELLHSCHSDHQNFCTGYLSYVEQNLQNGLLDLWLGRLAIKWKIVDRSAIPKLDVFGSTEEMLQSHQTKLEASNREITDPKPKRKAALRDSGCIRADSANGELI